MRIGLISDTHILNGEKLPQQVFQSFAEVDLILHAGDIFASSVLDELEAIAPVLAAQGNGNRDPMEDPRLNHTHTINIEGMSLGLIHNLAVPRLTIENIFNGNIDIIVYGDTHVATIENYKKTMLVNPGSPTFPNYWDRRLGTVAILEVTQGKAEANIIQLR